MAVLIATLATAPLSFADGVIIPGSIKVERFKQLMKEHGMDLYGGDDADGEIQNSGTKMKVVTYKPVTLEQMETMKEVATLSLRR